MRLMTASQLDGAMRGAAAPAATAAGRAAAAMGRKMATHAVLQLHRASARAVGRIYGCSSSHQCRSAPEAHGSSPLRDAG